MATNTAGPEAEEAHAMPNHQFNNVLLSALARNDPTLLAKNVQHHAKQVAHLPAGKSILLPRGKSQEGRSPVSPHVTGLFGLVTWSRKLNTLRVPSAQMTENHPARLRRG